VSNNLLTETVSAPLDGAKIARVDIESGIGNLTIDSLAADSQELAHGTVEYFEKQGKPTLSVTTEDSRTALQLAGCGAGLPWFRLPWTACKAETAWQIHLNPTVASEIVARTGGGNLKLDLASMAVTRLSADSGGGNLDVMLPEHGADLNAVARTGAGNVTVEVGRDLRGDSLINASSGAGNVVVHVPEGVAARLHASSGLGKVIVDPPFRALDQHTYQSGDYADARDRLDITVHSGAGNVRVNTT
jgi:hypothetical protein